jgi:hypothetical protein
VSAFYAKRAGDDGAKTGAAAVVQRTSGHDDDHPPNLGFHPRVISTGTDALRSTGVECAGSQRTSHPHR